MARMRVTTNTREFDASIRSAIERNPKLALQALRVEQLNTMNESQREVPVDTGVLRASKTTPAPFVRGGVAVAWLSYTAAYAFVVHENPRSGQTGGVSPSGQRYRSYARVGKWKYLEHPMKRAARGFSRRVGQYIMQRLWR